MSLKLTSSAFEQGKAIPRQYTGDGADCSPPLRWSAPPAETRSLVLICEDPDAPHGTWVHWVLFNMPSETTQLEEAIPTTPTLPNGANQGLNDFGSIGYGGPAPPKGKLHRYFFNLYALSQSLNLGPGSVRAEVMTAMQSHVLAEGQLMGIYQR